MSKQHSAGFLLLVADAKSRVPEWSIAEMQQQDQNFILIDVREDHEWQAGHLPNALHLGKGIIERDIETTIPDKTKTLVLYCGGGFRSALAADTLQKMGYLDVISLAGGFSAWRDAGLPIVNKKAL